MVSPGFTGYARRMRYSVVMALLNTAAASIVPKPSGMRATRLAFTSRSSQ